MRAIAVRNWLASNPDRADVLYESVGFRALTLFPRYRKAM